MKKILKYIFVGICGAALAACIVIAFTAGGLIDKKDAARIEQELQAILRSGTDAIMVHELSSVLAVPEVLAVFRKYCSPE